MATSVDDVLENILAGKIDRKDALQRFDEFSVEEKNRVVADLRARSRGEGDAASADRDGIVVKPAPASLLMSLPEAEIGLPQQEYLASLSRAFGKRMAKSKLNALSRQEYFVDQQKVAGLKRALQSMQFRLSYERAEGPYLHDVDGNRYVDIASDTGANFFGHQPQFLKDALVERLEQGYPLDAYSENLFESARLFCEISGHERMLYTRTVTEAVMWAVRIARAATGKKKVVIYDGSCHVATDNMLASRGWNEATVPTGLGALREFADQLIILDYGDPSNLDFIERNAADIACIVAEPVQSRFPARQPVQYVQELRRLTLENDIVLVFDERDTGFRTSIRGSESLYKVKPDMSVYDKVPGGGLPTGIIAGLAKYMNHIDGGARAFDDESMPSIRSAVVMADTHTHNSLQVSATLAICRQMQKLCSAESACDYATCSCAFGDLNRRTAAMCDEVNAHFAERRLPLTLEYFSSLFRLSIDHDDYGLTRELLLILLKLNGVETSASGSNFLNLTHKEEDIRLIIEGFGKAIDSMIEHGFFVEPRQQAQTRGNQFKKPAPAAKLRAKTSAAGMLGSGTSRIETLRELILADLRTINVKGH